MTGTRERNKEMALKTPNMKAVGNMLQTFSGVITMLISLIWLESIPKWQLKEVLCGHDG